DGATVNYVISVVNVGRGRAGGVDLAIDLPANLLPDLDLTFDAGGGASFDLPHVTDAGVLVIPLPLPSGAGVAFTLSGTVHGGTELTLKATASVPINLTDADPSDNSDSDTDAVRGAPSNSPPVANAGGAYAITEGDGLLLDASGSTDPDRDELTYSWDVNG